MEVIRPELTYRKIFLFWLPLASTWLMMSLEGPYLSALIARMPDPKFNLAAYGVAFSFAMIIEAPIIMMMSASNALVQNRQTYYALRNFTYLLNIIITGIILAFIFPPVFYFITISLINLPLQVAQLTHIAVIILIPWPAAIGYRRFYQGILIRNNLTKLVALGTVIRLTSMSFTGLILFLLTKFPGVVIGASPLYAGVVAQAIASKFMALKVIEN